MIPNLFSYLFIAIFCASSTLGAEVSGQVRVITGHDHDHSTIVVYAEALGEHEPPKPAHYDLKQHNKSFSPHILAIPVGSSVTFPNEDLIFHNVFSMSPPAPFDLGLYRAGQAKIRVFTQPEICRVFCNIHPQMSAVILVLPTNWITETNAQGMYHFDVPTGRYRVTAWSERSQPVTAEVDVASSSLTVPEMTLDESKFMELPHKNKFGQDYPPSAYENTDH